VLRWPVIAPLAPAAVRRDAESAQSMKRERVELRQQTARWLARSRFARAWERVEFRR